MTTYKEGDIVTLTKDGHVLKELEVGHWERSGAYVRFPDSRVKMFLSFLKESGWKIEKKIVLPTKFGLYSDRIGDAWLLSRDGWEVVALRYDTDSASNDLSVVAADLDPTKYLPFTRLVPEK